MTASPSRGRGARESVKGIPVPILSITDWIASKQTDRARDLEDVKALESLARKSIDDA